MTQQQALNWVNGEWVSSKYAKTISGIGTGIDVDGLYGFQCKDFANAYAEFMGNPFSGGNAIVLWTQPQPGWSKVFYPQIGDVFVRDFIYQGINYGDTGIVQSVTDSGVNVIQQNLKANLNQGSPPDRMFWRFNQLKGYLRNDNIGDDMSDIADNYFVQALAESLLGRTAAGDANLLNNVGRPKTEVLDTFRSYPEAMARKKIADAGGTGNVKPYDGPQLFVKKGE